MTRKGQRSGGERTPATGRRAKVAQGVPVTRGEDFVGLQMSLGLTAGKEGRKRATGRVAHTAAQRGEAEKRPGGLVYLTCPRCGRYLGAVLPGAAALCPRCGVWAK